jgi:hypothetical protein
MDNRWGGWLTPLDVQYITEFVSFRTVTIGRFSGIIRGTENTFNNVWV